MNELQIFEYEGTPVRNVMIEEECWWVLKDVCQILGINNHRDLPKRLDVDEVGRFELPHPQNPTKLIEMVCINESGLYNVILRSDKPKAKEFKRWVTHEVLPTIHKHGAYAVDDLLDNPELAIKAFTALKDERERRKALELENAQQKQIIGELQPKANYVDIILNNKSLLTITQIAKDYGMTGQKMNKLLSELGIQYKQSGQWLLYRQYHDKGYTHSQTIDIYRSDGRPDVVMETKWTQKGRLFLYELLKGVGIVPVIERDIGA